MANISIFLVGVLVVFAMIALTTFIMMKALVIAGAIVILGLFFWLRLSLKDDPTETTKPLPKRKN